MRKFSFVLLTTLSAVLYSACETMPTDSVTYSPPASQHHKLSGTSWVWDTELTQDPVIEFKANGHLGGFSGCNQIGGVFQESSEIKDGRHMLGMREVFSTEMACPSTMTIEQSFMQAIIGAKSFKKMSSDILVLFDHDGNEVLRLNRLTD